MGKGRLMQRKQTPLYDMIASRYSIFLLVHIVVETIPLIGNTKKNLVKNSTSDPAIQVPLESHL